MKPVFSMPMARYFDLPAGKSPFTKNANPVVIERIPGPERILGPQKQQSIFDLKM
jgi:hypothetical protein